MNSAKNNSQKWDRQIAQDAKSGALDRAIKRGGLLAGSVIPLAKIIGRPPLPRGEARVVLAAQRVAPATLAKLSRLAAQHGGVGRAIDAAVASL